MRTNKVHGRSSYYNLRVFARKWITWLLRRLPGWIKVILRILNATFKGEVKLTRSQKQIPKDVIEIQFSDDLHSIHARCGYHGLTLDHEQTPALAYHSVAGTLRNLGVLSTDKAEPKGYFFNFRGVELQYFTGSTVWPPSIISYILLANLLNSWNRFEQNVWDLGCGAGVIGIHLKQLTGCRNVHLTDTDPKAIEMTRCNAERMGLQGLTYSVETFPAPKNPTMLYDLIVCNPPWFPPEFVISGNQNYPTLDDLPLLKALLSEGTNWAKRMVFGYSGILHDEIMQNLNKLESRGIAW